MTMNVIAILNHMGVYFKEEPIRELHRALERLNFQIVYPNDRDDLLKLIENNARLCGVIFDWDKYNLELCEEISKMNENLPLYAFANTYSTLDVSLNDLRLQISFLNMRWVLLKILLIRSSRPLTNISTLICLR
ncbi:Orn/Lys/Arg decarboxylase N-terminal domain-containing protein [Escherichia coli]